MICERCKKELEGVQREKDNFQSTASFLKQNTLKFLEKTHYQFLCSGCLNEIESLVGQADELKASGKRAALIEDLHYYMENSSFVFTELYHIMKGYCCQNCCRHCAYGFGTLLDPVN